MTDRHIRNIIAHAVEYADAAYAIRAYCETLGDAEYHALMRRIDGIRRISDESGCILDALMHRHGELMHTMHRERMKREAMID
jgi:hypothetical protein